MEGLTIHKKVPPPVNSTIGSTTSFTDVIIGLLLFGAVLIVIPFLLIGLIIIALRDKFTSPKPVEFKVVESQPIILHKVPNDLFSLRYYYVMGNEISEAAWNYFGDDEPLFIYQSDTDNVFFEGYFSNFRIECPRGIFLQKVIFDSEFAEVQSMPLYFFNYNTKKAEEIADFKGYTIYTTKHPNHFTIIATNQDDNPEEFAATDFELEITLTDELYSPPEFYKF